MTTMEFAPEALRELLDGAEVVRVRPWRHGHISEMVFHFQGHCWRVEVPVHNDDGLQLFGKTKATRVHKVTRVVEVWEATL